MELTLEELVEKIELWLEEKKAENIKVYDVRNRSDYTDIIVVCQGSGDLHNKAIAENVVARAKEESVYVLGKEGFNTGNWLLIDLVSVIVHIFDEETRAHYDIEKLWQVSRQVRDNNEAQPQESQ